MGLSTAESAVDSLETIDPGPGPLSGKVPKVSVAEQQQRRCASHGDATAAGLSGTGSGHSGRGARSSHWQVPQWPRLLGTGIACVQLEVASALEQSPGAIKQQAASARPVGHSRCCDPIRVGCPRA
jgi:hypothetical protein